MYRKVSIRKNIIFKAIVVHCGPDTFFRFLLVIKGCMEGAFFFCKQKQYCCQSKIVVEKF